MITAQSLLWLMNQSGDALCYVSPGLWPPPLSCRKAHRPTDSPRQWVCWLGKFRLESAWSF